MKWYILIMFAALLSGCAVGNASKYTYTECVSGAGFVYLQLPRSPAGCVTRAYPVSRHMLRLALRDATDWKSFLREFYGMTFPRGGFAMYVGHTLIIADTVDELDHFAYLFRAGPSSNTTAVSRVTISD